MIGLDTNVLVRYITQDEPRQARVAEREIEKVVASGLKALIQPIILCELVWVLENAYGYEKGEIIAVIEQIIRTAQFEIAQKDEVWKAFEDFAEGSADFSDHFIGRVNERAGAKTTLTFDRSLKGSQRFTLL